MVENMERALASGINGFQFLTVVPPEFVKAAERVKEETGKMFYVAPEWCNMGNDHVKAAGRIADFALQYKDNPHLFRINGKRPLCAYHSPSARHYAIEGFSQLGVDGGGQNRLL